MHSRRERADDRHNRSRNEGEPISALVFLRAGGADGCVAFEYGDDNTACISLGAGACLGDGDAFVDCGAQALARHGGECAPCGHAARGQPWRAYCADRGCGDADADAFFIPALKRIYAEPEARV